MKKNYYEKLLDKLETYFGKIERKDENFFHELIKAILSQNTTDLNSVQAYNNLIKIINNDLQNLSKDEFCDKIKDSIKIAGLNNQKTKTLHSLGKKFLQNKNYSNIEDYFKKMKISEIVEVFLSIDGIGLKTVSCAILFGLHKPAFPVDTHISRIVQRVKKKKISKKDIQIEIEGSIHDWEKLKALHLYLIELGRNICRAKKQNCQMCPIKELCEDYRSK
ncbi:HhH-GPD family protein [Thermodesulfobium narugense DSM 14796]|uniref:HhH-GPD family protein n=1 Tax=Thermodesulfobium narugense DSM 14796 TaxID=747365 RepID=M1E8C4_9BACT|nr:HhH-GPD family protein [Thermodesulfobium narugense]AEE14394.1 HhH-GPD family protein [Thermodesulfobium narugense DSM 14796]